MSDDDSPPASRSRMKREAIMRGEPMPTFGTTTAAIGRIDPAAPVKSSPLRRWLREERARENVANVAEAADGLGPRTNVHIEAMLREYDRVLDEYGRRLRVAGLL